MEFTDDEIREELERLGYKDVPDDKLQEFKKDLLKLIQSERSKTNSLNSSMEEKHFDEPAKFSEDVTDSKRWREPAYREDWHYSGRPATAGATVGRHQRGRAAKSYGLFEQPLDDLDLEEYGYRGYREKEEINNSRSDGEGWGDHPDKSRKKMKRKTARSNHSSQTYEDDSAAENDAAGIYELYERVRNLAMRDCECNRGAPTTAEVEPPYRIHGVNKCPSLIRSGEPPHTRNLVRTIPWKRHQMYMRMWKAQPVVGEDNRNSLRKETQLRMLQKPDWKVQPTRKVFKPNKYVPPPQNPRHKLRWEIRRATSQYEMPAAYCSQYQAQCQDACY